ncbi:Pkinase-domain-containing protein [Phanerochaete sordida]|uniref:Pkinase-domain-containing protein n=1 Tax=Phanerochaete sordida TaxID=48140 RepID=A0A9P3FXG5_9APHY|nr:Pkinase-domain-containing protein [Phanerochaete sordida]
MLKFWPSTPADLTPRADPNGRERPNPFDQLAPLSPSAASTPPVATPSIAVSTGPTTPTGTLPGHQQMLGVHHPLLSPSISAPNGSDLHSPHLHPPPAMPLTPGGATSFAAPTTSLSLHAPEFTMQQPPPPKRTLTASKLSQEQKSAESDAADRKQPSKLQPSGIAKSASGSSSSSANGSTLSAPASNTSNGVAGPSRGQIHVKLIQARGLNVRSSRAKPYVVVQFEQNEFVSRDPIEETEKEVKGVATNLSRNSSSNALSALGAISDKINAKTNGRGSISASSSTKGSREHTPSSSVSSSKSGIGPLAAGMFGAKIQAHNPVWKHEVSFDVTSDTSLITFNIYDRSVNDLGFLGTMQIKPVLVHEHTVDQWYKLRPYENEPVAGEMRVQMTFEAYKTKRALTPRDFEFLKLIGRGTFGRVFQVRKKDTKRIYAMKVLSKREIVAKQEVAHTIGERKILQRSLESPFLVGLKFSFQTETDLYLVTDFKSGGELFWHLQRETKFSEERARFYVAELVLALEHLHKYDIVYRDLKPENILLDATGHVALCDFGLSKPDLRSDELTNTFCGTTEYLAPEVLLDEHGYSKLVDFWSLGVLLFEMCCGWSPFYAEDTNQMYKNICFGKIRFPKGVIGEEGKQFVKGLLNRNPKHRLGAQRDAAELKEHPFFKDIDWRALALKQVTPPFKPVVESDESVANFDPEFTSADVRDAGPDGIVDLDEEDPSGDWVSLSQSLTASTMHTPNGPLGSDRPATTVAAAPAAAPAEKPIATAKGIDIGGRAKKQESPLTSSVQENFRGFTYHGGESLVPASAGILGPGAQHGDEQAVQDEEFDQQDDEDEGLVGRYRRRGEGMLDGFDEDMHA